MEIKKPLLSDTYSNISAETSKDDVSRRASESTKGIVGAKDVFEKAKEAPFQSKLASHSVVQKGQSFTEQVVNNAAKGILEAARRNRNTAEDEDAIAHATAQAQLAISGVVATIPSIGPIISALLAAIAAMIQADGSQDKSLVHDQQRATPGWAALKKDRDD